ncbi:hypothetical protein V1279_003934 [Bradyrhizobium sp. AZCC 1610]
MATGAKGFVFLAGNTATTDDYEPFKKGDLVIEIVAVAALPD